MGDRRLGFGIIGCGMISDWHASAILRMPDAQLICACDLNDQSRARFSTKYHVPVYDAVEPLLDDPRVDAVCICVPSGLHAIYAVQCAGAGKHIVLEKPMAVNLQQADEIIRACDENNVKLTVISQFRFTPAALKLKEAMDSGMLGKPIVADLSMKFHRSQEYYDKGGWRGTWKMDGGGALMNQGIHGVDLLQHIMGPVRSVYAHTRTLARHIEVEDTAVAAIEFVSGALGVIQATTSIHPGYPRRLEVNASRGTIALEDDRIARWDVEGQCPPDDLMEASPVCNSSSDPAGIGFEWHFRQISDLADAIRTGRAPLVDQYEGRKAIEIIMAAYESSSTGKPISLSNKSISDF